MKTDPNMNARGGFTLMETVIAIGVLAVLLSAFLAVFTPAAQGIKNALSTQDADRMAYALETELTTPRKNETSFTTGFAKAFDWIAKSNAANNGQPAQPLVMYQYRGKIGSPRATDGTPEPFTGRGVSGKNFVVIPMVRKLTTTNAELKDDLDALDGRVYVVKLTQLKFDVNGGMDLATPGKIVNPNPNHEDVTDQSNYPEAVIAFKADFFGVPSSDFSYLTDKLDFTTLTKPVFTRNLAVRR